MSWLAARQRFLCCSWQRGDAGEAVEAEECSTRCVPEPSIPRLSKHFSPFSPAASFRCLWLHPKPGLWALRKHGVLMKLNISQWPVPSSGKAGLEPELGLSLGAAWIAGSSLDCWEPGPGSTLGLWVLLWGGLLHRKLHSRCWMQQSGLCTIPCVSFSVSEETEEKRREPGCAGGLLLRVLLVTRPQPFFQQWQELPCSNCLCPCSIPAPLRSSLDTC